MAKPQPINSQLLRQALTEAARQGVSADTLYAEIKRRGFSIPMDTVRKVQEHYRTVPAEATTAPPVTGAAPAPDPNQVATARAVETLGTGDTTTETAQNLTPQEEGAQALDAARRAIPGTAAVALSMALPELKAVAGPVGEAAALANQALGGGKKGKLAAGVIKGVPGFAGAGLGGSSGELVSEALSGSHKIDPEKIVREAENQMALHGVGVGMGKASAGLGRLMLSGVLKGTPEVVDKAVEMGIRPNQKGFDKLVGQTDVARSEVDALAKSYAKQGQKHDLHTQVDEATRKVYNDVVLHGRGPEGQTKLLQKWSSDYLNPQEYDKTTGLPTKLSPREQMQPTDEVLRMRRSNDKAARKVYKQLDVHEKGLGPPPDPQAMLRATWEKALANVQRRDMNMLDFDPLTMSSPMMKANEHYQDLVKLQKALGPALNRRSFARTLTERGLPTAASIGAGAMMTPGGLLPRAIGGLALGTVGHLVATPSNIGGLGLLLNNPELIQALRNFPAVGNIAMQMNKSQPAQP